MVDGSVCHSSLTVLISLYHEIVELKECHFLCAVDGAQGCCETQGEIEVDCLFNVVGGDTYVLNASCEIFDIHNVYGFYVCYGFYVVNICALYK